MATDNKTAPPQAQAEKRTEDLEVLLPSSEPGGEPCPVYFDQLCAELADIFDVKIERDKFKGAPLTTEQRQAIAYAAPKIKGHSKEITDMRQAPDANDDYVLDWELDDVKLAEGVLAKHIEVVRGGLTTRNKTFSANERTGTAPATWPDENTVTLHESKKLFTAQLGYEPDWISSDGKTFKWTKDKVTLVQGAKLRQTKNTEWLKAHTAADPSERTLSAGARLAQQFPAKEPWNLRLFTSAVGWGGLSEETKGKCQFCEMGGRIFLNQRGQIGLAANGTFDMSAVTELARDLKQRGTKLIDLHATFLRRKTVSFNDRKDWIKVLDAEVSDVEPYRRAIDLGMNHISRWTRQYHSATIGVSDEKYLKWHLLPAARRFMGKPANPGTSLTDEERQEMVEKHPWIADTLNVDHYSEKHAASTKGNRHSAIIDNTRNLCNASLADLTGLIEHSIFLPCHVDYEKLGRGEKVTSISLDFENPSTFIAILRDERAFDEVFDKVLRNALQEDTEGASNKATKRTPIIDETVARETKEWMEWQKMTASELYESLQSMPSPEQKDIDLAKGVLSACESGPMIKKARSVLYGSTERVS